MTDDLPDSDIRDIRNEFYRWAFKRCTEIWKRVSKAWPLIFAVLVFLSYLGWIGRDSVRWVFGDATRLEVAVQAFHAFVMLIIMVAVSRQIPRRLGKAGFEAVLKGRPGEFRRWWHTWWIFLVCFWGVMALRASGCAPEPLSNFILSALLNLLTVALLFNYLALVQPARDYGPTRRNVWFAFGVASFINVVTTGINIGSVSNLVRILSREVTDQHPLPQLAFMLVSGLAAGVGVALLVGRFESTYLRTPQPILVLLYIYALIQATYGLYNSNLYVGKLADANPHVVRIAISIVFLVLKLVLFAFVTWLMTGGRLMFYFDNIRPVVKGADAEWKILNDNEKGRQ